MLINKRFFLSTLICLFLCVVFNVIPVFAGDIDIQALRLSGTNRYTTSVAISKAGWAQSSTVIIATGLDYADALSASTLAKSKDAPILLTEKIALSQSTLTEIKRLKAAEAILVGGTGVIGVGVENQLKNLEISIIRIDGIDRYDTSKKIAVGGDDKYSTNLIINTNLEEDLNFDTIYLATGNNFSDALSGSALATKNKAPIFLTPKDSISTEILDFIKLKKVKQVVILGGIGVISKDVENLVVKSLLLLQQERKSKGGVIGTSGKGVVSLRFDDYQNVFGKEIFPLLLARGLPCSMALISRFNVTQPWGIGTTWNEVRNWNRNGVEIWSHGTDHKDYSSKGYSGLYSQIVTSKAEIEAQNIKVVGWALPGVTPSTKAKNSLSIMD